MDMAKTLCESLSCLQQFISMVMRDGKLDSSMRDGF